MRVRSTQNLALTLLAVSFCVLLFDVTQIFKRTIAENYVIAHGLPCMALSDPTVGAFPLTDELNLLAQTDWQAVTYF
jgi:hypothetical protein